MMLLYGCTAPTHFHEAKAQAKHGVNNFRVLIKARCQTCITSTHSQARDQLYAWLGTCCV